MTTNKQTTIAENGGDEPVGQAEFSTTMTSIKATIDQLATKADLEQVSSDLADVQADVSELKADVSSIKQTTERILDLIQGMDERSKSFRDLPERMERVERAIFP